MAGVGFVLKKLMSRNDLSGVVQAYIHATFASSGPWLTTILAIAMIQLLNQVWIPSTIINNFRAIILYNFAFTLVFTAPVSIVSTRYLADCFYLKNLTSAPGMLVGGMVLLFVILLPISASFYFFFAAMSTALSLLSIVNFLLVAAIWQISVFLTALKHYSAVTFAFFFGMLLSIICTTLLAGPYGVPGMVCGFNIGLAFLLACLIGLIFTEYPLNCSRLFAVLPYFKNYWHLAVGGIAYNAGIWVDKWIMWFAPERSVMQTKLILYHNYDSAIFVAYLTIVPTLAMFFLAQEVSFFETYLRFYRGILNHDNFKKISRNHGSILRFLAYEQRNLLLMQLFIGFTAIVMAPVILKFLGMNYIEIGMFRYGVMGATLQILTLFLLILLAYFDYRIGAMMIQILFFVSNALFTFISMKMGFPYYGYGYFLSTLLTFVVAAIVVDNYDRKLPYNAFLNCGSSQTDL